MSKTIIITPDKIGRSKPPIVAAFDLPKVAKILRRNAIAKSFQLNTRLEWKRYEDPVVRFFSIGEPGLAEIEISSNSKVDHDIKRFYTSNLRVLRKKSRNLNGAAILDFLEQMEIETRRLKNDVRNLYRRASRLNDEIREEAAWTTDKLFAIKVSAEVVFAGAAVLSGIGLIAGVGIGVTYGLISNFAMNRHDLLKSDIITYTENQGEKLIPPTAAGVVATVASDAAIKKSQDYVFQARLAMSAEAAALKNYQELFQPNEQLAPRQLRKANLFNRSGSERGAAKSVARVSGYAKALGFVTSLYFMKDDIAMAMKGYSASMGY